MLRKVARVAVVLIGLFLAGFTYVGYAIGQAYASGPSNNLQEGILLAVLVLIATGVAVWLLRPRRAV